MGQVDEGTAIVTGQFAVGLSAVIGLTLIAGQVAPTILRYLRGGTLEIVGTAGTMVGTGFSMVPSNLSPGSGFQIQAGDPPLAVNCASTIYFISSGATSVFGYIQHRSADYS